MCKRKAIQKIIYLILLVSIVFLWSCSSSHTRISTPSKFSNKKLELIYWRHYSSLEKEAITNLIKKYEEKNPDIKIHLVTMPYDTYVNKLVTTLAAGKGPHIVNLHNSWAYNYIKSGLLLPVDKEIISYKEIEEDFFPAINSFRKYGLYYGLPIGIGNLALYYNVNLFEKAELSPDSPPETWQDLLNYAKKLTVRDKKTGRILIAGADLGHPGSGQGWNYLVDSLFPQNDAKIINEEGTKVLWNSKNGIEAFKFYTDFITKYKVNSYLFPSPYFAFRLGRLGMLVEGTWLIKSLKKDIRKFKWRVAKLPYNKFKAVYGSFWANCVTKRANKKQAKEAWKFIKYLSSTESMEYWADKVGELPVRKSVAQNKNFIQLHPELKPFIEQLPYTNSSLKKNEATYRLAITTAIERVVLMGYPPEKALNIAAEEINKMLQQF